MAERTPHHRSNLEQVHPQSRLKACARLQASCPLVVSSRTSSTVAVYFYVVVSVCLWSVLVELASCTSASVQASDVSPTSFGTFNLREIEEVVYNVDILTVPVPETLTTTEESLAAVHSKESETKSSSEDGDNEGDSKDNLHEPDRKAEEMSETRTADSENVQHVTLYSKYGQKYICTLPLEVVNDDAAMSDSENETNTWSVNVSSLLQPLKKRPCLTKNTGWWTYEYCHGEHVRQYHSEAAKTVKNLWIGNFQNETIWNEEEINKAKALVDSLRGKIANYQVYHSVYYVNGTTCDLTGKPRRATAQIYCSLKGEDRLVSVQEKETCDYVLHIETPLLCRDPLFDVISRKKPVDLSCSPVVSEEEYRQFTERQEQLKREKEQQLKEKQEQIEVNKKKLKESSSSSSSFKSTRRSSLFDSGYDDDIEAATEKGREKDEELLDMADKFDESLLDEVAENLNNQLSKLAKEKGSFFKTALQNAIESTLKTVTKMVETKKEKQSEESERLRSEIIKEEVEETQTLSEKTSSQEKAQTELREDELEQEDGDLEQKQSTSRTSTVEGEGKTAKKKEEKKSTLTTLDTVIEMLMDMDKPGKTNKHKEIDGASGKHDHRQLDKDDLDVEDEEDEGEELDEESLSQLADEVTSELQKKLNDAGQGDDTEIRVKFFTLSPDELDELFEEDDVDGDGAFSLKGEGSEEEEEEEVEGDEEELEVDAYGNPKQSAKSSSVTKDYPAGSSIGGSRSGSGTSKRKLQKKSRFRGDDEVKVITLKLDSLFQLSDEDDEDKKSPKGAKGGSGDILSAILDQFMNPMTEERKRVQELESNYEQVWDSVDDDEEESEKRRLL